MLQLRESSDPKVSMAEVAVKTYRRRREEVPVKYAELQLHHGVSLGAVARGRAGFGTVATPHYDKASGSWARWSMMFFPACIQPAPLE